jgi:hypothetical protein
VRGDPYRSEEPGGPAPPVVLAGPNRLRTGWHLLLTLGLIGGSVYGAIVLELPMWIAIAILAACAAADVARTLHEAVLPHRVLATEHGLELSWATRNGWRPWMRRRSVAIAWDDIVSVQTHTVRGQYTSTTELHIQPRLGPRIDIADGTFDPHAGALQVRILDEIHARRQAPARAEARIADFCRQRFSSPMQFHWRSSLSSMITLGIVGVVMLAFGSLLGGYYGGWLWLPATVSAATGAFMLWLGLAPPKYRVLILDADGLSAGPTATRLTRTDWDAITYARPTVVNGDAIRLVIRTDHGPIALHGDWGIELRTLAQLIDPPPAAVRAVRERIAAGATMDDAVRDAGLAAPEALSGSVR